MIDREVDSGRVPDFRNAHLAKHFDCKRSSAVLGHCKVSGQHSDVSWAMDLVSILGPDADDLLSEGQRVVVQNVLAQQCSEAGEKTGRY